MKIFISHSLGYTDAHLAVLLSQQAQAKGFTVESSQSAIPWAPGISEAARRSISSSDLVVAIVSADSQLAQTVYTELNAALSAGKPVLALVEHGVQMPPIPGTNYVYFDRYNLRPTLAQINGILEEHQGKNLKAWAIAGGLALLALYLMSQE
jgi:hypothetical protein